MREGSTLLQILFCQFRQFHQMALQAELQCRVAMNGNGQSRDAALTPVNVMAAIYAQKIPATPLNQFGKGAARNGLHRAISRILSRPPGCGGAMSMARQPSIASCKLASNSFMVSPWVTQPGMAGTSAQNPPSSASWIIALMFMSAYSVLISKIRLCCLNASEAY